MKFVFGSILVILGCLSDSIWSQERVPFWRQGWSSYCDKASASPRYPATRKECCTQNEYKCTAVIGPQETKFGLTNPDTVYSRRHCNCDLDMYGCLVQDEPKANKDRVDIWFGDEYCIDVDYVTCSEELYPTEYGSLPECVEYYKFVSISNKIPQWQGSVKPAGNPYIGVIDY